VDEKVDGFMDEKFLYNIRQGKCTSGCKYEEVWMDKLMKKWMKMDSLFRTK